MKYRAKINTPWGQKGQIFYREVLSVGGDGMAYSTNFNLSDYSDLFEPVEDKSDEVLLHEFLLKKYDTIGFVKALLSSNAINPDFLTKLRSEQK